MKSNRGTLCGPNISYLLVKSVLSPQYKTSVLECGRTRGKGKEEMLDLGHWPGRGHWEHSSVLKQRRNICFLVLSQLSQISCRIYNAGRCGTSLVVLPSAQARFSGWGSPDGERRPPHSASCRKTEARGQGALSPWETDSTCLWSALHPLISRGC